jgi:chromosome partitioning protein
MVISLVNQKGGVDKTTVAINLASGLAMRDFLVLLVDSDPQGSVLKWHSVQNPAHLNVARLTRQFNSADFRKRTANHDYVVIDVSPAMRAIIVNVLDATDLVLIPVSPSALDLWSSKQILALLEKSRQKNRRMDAKVLICRKITGTRVGREAREAVDIFGLDEAKQP